LPASSGAISAKPCTSSRKALNELRKAGALTDQEFDAKKAELLARM
jgi:hypothetical protein